MHIALACFLIIGLIAPRGAAAQARDLSAQDQALVAALATSATTAVLENGLTVVVLPDHRAPVVALHLAVPFGSARDGQAPQGAWPARPGLAHFVEHLLYAGSPHAPGGAYDSLLAAAGGDNNAWTEHDAMAVHAVVPSGALELALFLEADRMVALDPDSVAARLGPERDVVAQERAVVLDSPGGLDHAALRSLVYPPQHPDHWPVLGTPAALDAVTVDDVIALHAAAFAPGQAVLVMVGDVVPDAALALAERWLGAVPSRPVPPPMAPPPSPTLPARGLHTEDVAGTTLYATWALPPTGDPELPALDMLAEMLDQETLGPWARPLARRRLERARAWVAYSPRGGRLIVELGARRGSARWLQRRLDRVVDGLVARPPDAAAVERARAQWRNWAARAQEDPETHAELIASCQVEEGRPDCFADFVAAHLAVDAEAIHEVSRTWLRPEGQALLTVVAPGNAGWALPDSTPVDVSVYFPAAP